MKLARLFVSVVAVSLMGSLPLAGQTSLDFTKSFNPETIGPGSTSTLQFEIDNLTSSPVSDLAFTDVFIPWLKLPHHEGS